MFNLSGSELLIIAMLGLVVLGPEKLPGAMKRVGKIYREIRNITDNVQREVQKAMDEPIKQLKETQSAARDVFEGKMPHLATPNFRQGTSAASAKGESEAESDGGTSQPDSATDPTEH
ncbi:MAG: twin-arginine translocase subunit TatB [Actinobacteria bacterium]|nr:twin-arginine translocase subunit TatB [Actinomycetota bacterium]